MSKLVSARKTKNIEMEEKFCTIEHVKTALDEFTDVCFTKAQINSLKPFGLGDGKPNHLSYNGNMRGNLYRKSCKIIDSTIQKKDDEIKSQQEKLDQTEKEKTEAINEKNQAVSKCEELTNQT